MYQYKSDYQKFLEDFLEKNPEEQKQRLINRAVLWDVQLKDEDLVEFNDAEVKRKAYSYLTD